MLQRELRRDIQNLTEARQQLRDHERELQKREQTLPAQTEVSRQQEQEAQQQLDTRE